MIWLHGPFGILLRLYIKQLGGTLTANPSYFPPVTAGPTPSHLLCASFPSITPPSAVSRRLKSNKEQEPPLFSGWRVNEAINLHQTQLGVFWDLPYSQEIIPEERRRRAQQHIAGKPSFLLFFLRGPKVSHPRFLSISLHQDLPHSSIPRLMGHCPGSPCNTPENWISPIYKWYNMTKSLTRL